MTPRSYGRLALRGESWVVSDLEPHVAIRFKANFPGVPKNSAGPFELRAIPVISADLAWFVARYPLAASAEVLATLEAGARGFEAIQAEVGRIMVADYQPPVLAGLRPGQSVRAHQGRAAELLSRFGGLLVGDDVGEGKTYTGGACCLLPGALPATIVCPPHLKTQWRDKLREFTTLSVHIVQGSRPHALPPCDVRIFGYTQLSGWIDMLEAMGTGLAVFDEAHALRNGENTAKGAGAAKLAAGAVYRLGLTATPIFNYGDEIWRLMSFIRPEVLGDYPDFQREWCGYQREVADPEALGAYLREQHAMIRKRGSAPEPNTIVVEIDHDARQLATIADHAARLALAAKHGPGDRRGLNAQQLDMMVREETGVAKAGAVAAYVRILVEAGRPVVLFGWHRRVYDIWREALADLGVVFYTGTESPAQKEAAKRAFLQGRAGVFVMSLRSGEGVDGLQARSHTVVNGELDWSPAIHQQNVGRLNREGQACWPGRVDQIFLVSNDGSDPVIQEVLGLKASQAHGVVDPGMGPQRVVRDSTPLERLVERYIAKAAGVAA